MIVAIHQPQYMPWIGYFDKIDKADVFVILDNVQYKKNEWQNRNRIKTVNGWQWLTVPVLYKFSEKINEVKINNRSNWQRKHMQALTTNYAKSPMFAQYKQPIEDILSGNYEYLSQINIALIKYFIDVLGIDTRVFIASEFDLTEEPTGRLIDICKATNSNTYLSGKDGINYLSIGKFEEYGIKIIFQDFKPPVYNQLYHDFEPGLSIIDLLFNYGEGSLDIIRNANTQLL